MIQKKTKKDSKTSLIEKKIDNSAGIKASPSVITKTRTPQIIVKSEHINDKRETHQTSNYELLKSICLCVMGMIVLITFFLSLKTYQIVSQGLLN